MEVVYIASHLDFSCAPIAGKTNVDADRQSRQYSDNLEWMLDKRQFQIIKSKYPQLEIDLFASRLNTQLSNYVAWKPDPECMAVDAFTIPWKFNIFYAFPPFSLIPQVIQKVIQDQATGIIITPFWTTQTWCSQLQLTWDSPWILKQSPTLL